MCSGVFCPLVLVFSYENKMFVTSVTSTSTHPHTFSLLLTLELQLVRRFSRDMNKMADLPKRTAKLHMAFGLLLILGILLS